MALSVLLPMLFVSCSSKGGPGDPDPEHWGDYTGNLVRALSGLDTITPPTNPLHPLTAAVANLECYCGYLDCARYVDNKRYCALIGSPENGRNVYFLVDSTNSLFRYDSPLVADFSVCEILYVRGILEQVKHDAGIALLLHVVDIEGTDSIDANPRIYRY